jgi:hypothetical protein
MESIPAEIIYDTGSEVALVEFGGWAVQIPFAALRNYLHEQNDTGPRYSV